MSKGKQGLMPLPPPGRWIERIKIRDFLAIENADIKVGNGLMITGRNGSGKTTILHALQAVFDKNMRTKMVRLGEEQGEVMLVMSDGTMASRKISDDGAERPLLKEPNGKAADSPATKLQAMAPALLLNPVRFVHMDEAQKAKILADVFPVELSQAELEAICGADVDLREVEPDGNGLARANQAYKAAYAARHGANGELKQAESSRDVERKKIPVGFDAQAVRNLSSEAIAQELARIEHHNRLVVDGGNLMTRLEGDEKNLNTAIDNLKRELAEKEAQLTEVKSRLKTGREWLEKHKHIDPAPTQATLHTLDQQRMYLHCFDQAQAYDLQCREITSRALRLDAIVATLKALPGELVRRAKIPIEGLTIENGVVHVNGLAINNLSEGEQYRVAARVAAAGAKDLALVCIDGAERLSEAARNKLIDDLQAEGIQVFMTVADECDFNIRDLEGNPVEASVVIPPRADAKEPVPALAAPATQQARAISAPRAAAKTEVTADAVRAPTPVAKPTGFLFEPASEEESLFGEPMI